jgi:hypothetical protein
MLPLTRGFARSITTHNVDVNVMADWIEGSALFMTDSKLTGSEVVDSLIEEEVYEEQSLCWARVEEAMQEIKRRSRLRAVAPLRVSKQRIERVIADWRDVPAHSFLLLLTLAQRYDNWAQVMPIDYNEQGQLFENVTKESLMSQFPDWVIHSTGWSRVTPTKLSNLVAEIAHLLGEVQGEVKAWTNPEAKEAGLDLLCFRPFADGLVGIPLLLMQCASGDWKEPGKLKTPDIDIWSKIIIFASQPKRAFATHYAFLKDEFRKVAGKVNGVLIDRYRLLHDKPDLKWLSLPLKDDLIKWLDARIQKLPDLKV